MHSKEVYTYIGTAALACLAILALVWRWVSPDRRRRFMAIQICTRIALAVIAVLCLRYTWLALRHEPIQVASLIGLRRTTTMHAVALNGTIYPALQCRGQCADLDVSEISCNLDQSSTSCEPSGPRSMLALYTVECETFSLDGEAMLYPPSCRIVYNVAWAQDPQGLNQLRRAIHIACVMWLVASLTLWYWSVQRMMAVNSESQFTGTLPEDATCAICREDMTPGEPLRRLPCKHVYHRQCIGTALLVRPNCPICNDAAGESATFDVCFWTHARLLASTVLIEYARFCSLPLALSFIWVAFFRWFVHCMLRPLVRGRLRGLLVAQITGVACVLWLWPELDRYDGTVLCWFFIRVCGLYAVRKLAKWHSSDLSTHKQLRTMLVSMNWRSPMFLYGASLTATSLAVVALFHPRTDISAVL